MQQKKQGYAYFGKNHKGQLEHLIKAGDYTLHIIVPHKCSDEQLSYIIQRYLAENHHGRFPLHGNETLSVVDLYPIE